MSRRAVLLGLGGRFTDELLSELPGVLMPTLRAHFRLTYTQITLLDLALRYTAAAIEPGAGLLVDVWQRRWLLAWGAAGVGLSTMLLGLAPSFLFLLAASVIYGLASGPLAHTADIVLVEAHPAAPERIFTRATMLDTVGALLSPLSVAIVVWAGVSWRWLLLALGLSSFAYAALILRTTFPSPANGQSEEEISLLAGLRDNLHHVLHSRDVLRWLVFMFALEILETPNVLRTVWLSEQVGMGQALVALYIAFEMAVHLFSLFYLDRWLARSNARRILQAANIALFVVIPLWLFTPGILPRFLLAVPLNFFFAFYWPIGRAQSLTSAPGRAGAVTALNSLFGLIPVTLLFGLLAEAVSLTSATLWVSLAALAILTLLTAKLPPSPTSDKRDDPAAPGVA